MELNVSLPDLHVKQQEVEDGSRRFTILRAGRQSGKSWYAARLAVKRALEQDNQFIMILAPTYKQTEAIYGRIRKLLRPILRRKVDGVTLVTENRTDKSITFFNDSQIMAMTADDPERLRGFSIDLVIVDEAASLPSAEFWIEIIRPALAVTKGDALFISTPKGKANWFYNLWKWAEADIEERPETTPWALFHFKSTDSPYFPDEEAAEARKLGENVYLQEYEAEFVATGNSMIGEQQFAYFSVVHDGVEGYISYRGKVYPQNRLLRVLVCDLAVKTTSKADNTALVVADMSTDGTAFVRNIWANRVPGHKLARHILNHAKQWEVDIIYVESTAFQYTIVQQLVSMGATTQPIYAKGDKIARVTLLGVRMSEGQVCYEWGAPWLPATIDEVTTFPDGAYDDRADALAYLAHQAAAYATETGHAWGSGITLDQVLQGLQEDHTNLLEDTRHVAVEMRAKVRDEAVARGKSALYAMRGPM